MNKLPTLALAATLALGSLFGSTAFAGQYRDNLERWVDIVNDSNLAIFHVEISNIDRSNWGRDLLGEDEIIYGYDEMRIEPRRPNGYCRFDVRVTYEDETQVELWDVNLCEAIAIIVDDDGYTDVEFG